VAKASRARVHGKAWVREVRDQFLANGVAFFFKQWWTSGG
jgi:protein gp37